MRAKCLSPRLESGRADSRVWLSRRAPLVVSRSWQIDELENGLDPHRLIHLLRHLRAKATDDSMQVFITTHSPLVVSALDASEMQVIRSQNGTTTATPVPADLTSHEQPRRASSLLP
jgi:predicted ATPase